MELEGRQFSQEIGIKDGIRKYIMDLFSEVEKEIWVFNDECFEKKYTELNYFDYDNKFIRDRGACNHRWNLLKDTLIEVETKEYYCMNKEDYRDRVQEFIKGYSIEGIYHVDYDFFDKEKMARMEEYQIPVFKGYKEKLIYEIDKIFSKWVEAERVPYRCRLEEEEIENYRDKLNKFDVYRNREVIGWTYRAGAEIYRIMKDTLENGEEKRIICIPPRENCGSYMEREGVELDSGLLEGEKLHGDICVCLKDMSVIFLKDHEGFVYKYKGDECCE